MQIFHNHKIFHFINLIFSFRRKNTFADVCAKCEGINVPILQFQGCKCIVSVEVCSANYFREKYC